MIYHTNKHFIKYSLIDGLYREYLYVIYGKKLKEIYKISLDYNNKKYIIEQMKINYNKYKYQKNNKYIVEKNLLYKKYNKALDFIKKKNNKIINNHSLSISVSNYFKSKYIKINK